MKLTEAAIASEHSETTNGGRRRNTRSKAENVPQRRRGRRPRNGTDGYTLDELLAALQSLETGDFKARLPERGDPVLVEIAATFNRLTTQSERVCDEIARIGRTVGREGKMTDRARVVDLRGGWLDTIDSVNSLISDLDQLAESVGVVLNMIAANMRTEELLEQSQALTGELQAQCEELKRQQEELRRSNSELETQARTLKVSEKLLKEQQEELQQVNEELEEKAAQLSISSKYKSEFLANMSHELRTPLNSLLILARQLSGNSEGNLSARQAEFAQTILSSGTDLLSLINDILDLSKVEAGKMEVHTTTFAVREVADFCERSFHPLAQEKNLSYDVLVESDTLHDMRSDRQRLQQVLKNLLSNAFKFTEKGGLSLRIGTVPKQRFANAALDQADSVLAFTVADSGIGIARDKQRLIFEAFQQADGTTSRRYGGTGLGLSISREIARVLGGEIRVESEEGQGSMFTLYLPVTYEPPVPTIDDADWTGKHTDLQAWRRRRALDRGSLGRTLMGGAERFDQSMLAANEETQLKRYAETIILKDGRSPERLLDETALFLHRVQAQLPETRRRMLEQLHSSDAIFADKQVLVVDDDVRNIFALTSLLEANGMRVSFAENGREAIEVLKREPAVDLVLMDVMMPELDGYDATRAIRNMTEFRALPIIALTAKAMKGDREKCIEAGASDYITKPVDSDQLLSLMRVWLYR